MARIRTIKPEFFLNDKIADLHPLERILFIGLWTQADREGRLEDRPKRIKAAILPYDKIDIDKFLDSLHNAGFIYRYVENNTNYIEVLTFKAHQYPNIKEPASTIPAPSQYDTSIERLRKGSIGKGKERKDSADTMLEFKIPEYINPEIWKAFLDMRTSIKKPLKTNHQIKLAISTLEKLKSQGHNPDDILNQSILNSWQGLFPLKINQTEPIKKPSQEYANLSFKTGGSQNDKQ